jgi:calcium/calmodulin-dependent protein kinase-4
MIKNCQFDFPSPYWDDVSDVAKDLIRSLLVRDPQKRLDAEQLLSHPWVIGEGTPRKQLPNVTQQIKEYNTRRKFKRATYLVMAANRFSNILKLNK